MSSSSDFGQHFAVAYAAMSERELFRIARAYDTLTEPAQAALRSEFARRNLEPPLISGRDELESRDLVTIRRYRDLSEAIVARAVIESAGLFCFLKDENLVRLDWQVSNLIGGIRLQVDAADVEAASELLSQPIPESISFAAAEEYEQPHCPRCGSIDITFQGADRSAALVSVMVIGLPLPLGKATWICESCGASWLDERDSTAETEAAL